MGLMEEVRVTHLVTLLLDGVSGRGALKARDLPSLVTLTLEHLYYKLFFYSFEV